jgi:hypothetical protein
LRTAVSLAIVAFICASLAWLNVAETQEDTVIGSGITGMYKSGGSSGCAAATNFIARTSNPGGTQNSAWTNFICGGVTDGWWSSMDVVNLYAADSSADAILNLVSSSYTTQLNNSPTFTAYNGYNNPATGGGPSEQISAITSGNYTQNSASFGICLVEVDGSSTYYSQSAMNQYNITGQNLYPKFTDGNTYIRINDASGSAGIANSGNTTGLWFGNRDSSTTSEKYLNGSSIGTSSQSSAAISTNAWFIGYAETIGYQYNGLVQAVFIGGSLSSTYMANIASRLHTYLAAVGASNVCH